MDKKLAKLQKKSVYDLQQENVHKNQQSQKENRMPRKYVKRAEKQNDLVKLTQKAIEEAKRRQWINPLSSITKTNQNRVIKTEQITDDDIFKKPKPVPKLSENSFSLVQKHQQENDTKKRIFSLFSTMEDFYRTPCLLSPLTVITEIENLVQVNPNPFALQLKERLIDAELKNMIDNFAKNIENLANGSETGEIESFIGRKRKVHRNDSLSMSSKRQKC